jgi:16S rRNA (cytosine967-C5)-methyltransferase
VSTPVATAELTAAVAPAVLHSVVREHRHLAPAITAALEGRGRTTFADRSALRRSLAALLRWWGWIEPLQLPRVEEQLLLGWLLDSSELSPMARVWAGRIGRHPEQLYSVGDAPNWTARADGLKRWVGSRPVNADPWRLFPAWFRDQLPVPPGTATPRMRRLDLLAALQTDPSLWVGARGEDEKSIWNSLREAEIKPWIHRQLPSAAKLPLDTDLMPLESFKNGSLVIQDVASQAVAVVCDPDRGDRWWDIGGESGHHALHLAALMKGKGVVVSTFENERRRQATAEWLRRSAFRNITTRLWDRRHPSGKTASYSGVLVDAPCSGVGSWRRHPEARWTIPPGRIAELGVIQLQSLTTASRAVRPGGALVYTVATVTRCETVELIAAFLAEHSDFHLEPFPHPLEQGTTSGVIQLWPQVHECDARFIARMVRKPSSRPAASKAAEKQTAVEKDPAAVASAEK